MARITDYASLQTAVANWLDRKDLAAEVPTFIQLCESQVNRVLRDHDLLCIGQSVGWRTDAIVPLPDDWVETRNVTLILSKENPDVPGELIDGEKYQLTYQPPDAIDQMKVENPQWRPDNVQNYGGAWDGNPYGSDDPSWPQQNGSPQTHYTYRAGNIEVWPAPQVQFRLDIEYHSKVGLTDEAPTNKLLDNDPDIYLYGALMHSAPFLRDDARIMVWTKLYEDGVGQKTEASKKALTSGSRLTRKTNASMG